ncbi:putative multidrug resistance-associated protein lethal(2)03659-like Protein [Tribolium castaneum]|uniref:ABC-type glutathione-S-conjugate transporter n=1 Tax=Tribolium castaneum TaxID=7070 RepID=A0A139WC08_TRICA|nr:putative multidrug resistance-associated protein lethal(2)03659-like Protein [Tribolium castaneum]
MDKFCGSEFWNSTLTWHTNDPDLTKCFERTVLVWVPCAFLWTFSSLEVYYILHSKRRDIPWNWLNVSKLLGTAVLFVLTVTDLVTAVNSASSSESDVYKVDIYTPVIKLLSFGLSAVLLVYNRKYGLCTSGLQFLFWLSLAICGAFQYRTELRGSQEEIPESRYSYISYLIYYPVVLVMLFLNCFADRSPRRSEYPKLKNPCPEENSSFLSRLLFSWFDPLAWRGFRRPLVDSDLWDMKPEDSASEVVPTFEKHWKRILQKCESNSPTRQTRASYKLDSARVDIVNSSTKKQASILPALVKAFGPTFIFGALLKLIQDLLTFVSPHILNLLIQFVKNNEEQWKGFLYAGALFVTATIQTIVLSQYFNRMFVVGMRIRTALVSAIYKKALRVSNKARKESTVGEIVNLMSVDAQKFIDLTAYINMIWSAPLQIILALYFLWNILGPAVLAGLAVMIILIPVNGYIANKVKVLQIKQMKNKDERVKLMNEVLSGIKVLKLYAWEPSFEKQILKIRTKEIQVLKEAAYMNAGTSFIWSCAPFLVSLVSFGTYVMVDEHNILDASKAFVSVSLFNILRFPLSMLPMMISNLVQAMVSIQRINKFMNAEELDPTSVTHDSNESAPLVIENGCFNWDEEQVLKNINIRIEKKSLCAVVGSVGSGKSSLLSAFLGEMDKTSGRVNTVGTIAYVSQQAWIQNATLRDNILFGKSFDKSLYDKVVEACALNPDFAMLPAGDQTEIGEKGINLSGGQKQRVSLARAVYANSDIYFLDDPLSAVDSHVGKHIFDKVIGPEGLLRHKTRVLVTHGITYLPQTDKIIVLKDGEVSEGGTYQELLDKKGAFSEFLLQHINEVEEDEEELDVLKSQLSGTAVSEEINKKLSRHRSRVSESVSETGSDQTSLSLQRQKSVESADKSLRHRSSSVEEAKKVKGEKLIEVEKAETGSVKWIVYKHYLKSIGVFLTVATILLNMLFQGFSIGSNVWLGVWADDDTVVVDNVTDTGKRDFYLGIYGALGIGQAVATLLSALSLYIGAVNGAQLLHHLLLSNILRVPCTTFFDVTPVGRILNRFSKDVDTLDNILPMTLRGWITCFFSVLGTLVVISVSTPIFIAVIVPIGILYYFIQRFYVATSRQLKRLESVSRSPIYSHFGETITGVQAIRAFREQDRFIKESEHRVDVNQVCYYPSIISNRWLAVRLEMIGNLIIFFAALFSVLGRDESQNAGLVGLSVTYSLQITQTLNWLVRMTSDVETNIVAVERIKEYGEAPQEAPWEIPNKAPSPQWPENGTVQFNKYAVRYRPGLDLVLKGVNFSINGGEKVGIVGRTGAGKSSLTLALFRIIEAAEGEILIDGVNIADLGLHTLRSRLTIIPQDAVLFSGTLRMNLDPFDKHSDEEVWKALEHAHLKSFVKGLTAGLHHEVTEGGENLSVGQRQLICLSRALLRKTKVLILDEATAAVDLETDDLIQKTIRSEFKNCTVLTIAHRLNTIMDSDRVVVLDNGRIVEFDSPSNLLKQQQSIFYSMCKDAGLV